MQRELSSSLDQWDSWDDSTCGVWIIERLGGGGVRWHMSDRWVCGSPCVAENVEILLLTTSQDPAPPPCRKPKLASYPFLIASAAVSHRELQSQPCYPSHRQFDLTDSLWTPAGRAQLTEAAESSGCVEYTLSNGSYPGSKMKRHISVFYWFLTGASTRW